MEKPIYYKITRIFVNFGAVDRLYWTVSIGCIAFAEWMSEWVLTNQLQLNVNFHICVLK